MKTAKAMKAVKAMNNPLTTEFRFKGIDLRLSLADSGVWRVQSKSGSSFDDMGAAQTLAKDLGEEYEKEPLPFETVETDGKKRFVSGDGTAVEISGNAVIFFDKNSRPVREITDINKAENSVTVTFAALPDERFYGTGERFDAVNQRGKKVNIYAVDRWCQTKGNSYIPIPFLMSSACNALLFNRYERTAFDICSSNKKTLTVGQFGAPLDLYIFTGDTPADILSAYCRLTGFAPMPPEWSFGTLVCRYHPEFQTKEGVFAMMEAMKKEGFPWDAVILEGFRPYKTENLPELKEICDRVHSEGKYAMVYEQCGRFPDKSEEYFGLDDSYAVNSDEGTYLSETSSFNLVDNFNKKKMRCIDLTSERSREKWRDYWNGYINDIGIEGAKIDFCEQFPDDPSIKFADGRNPAGAHHWYPTLYNTLQYRRFNTKSCGGVNFSRGGSIGAQRYPFVWAGDQRREFYFLKPVIRAALSLGFSGVPFVSWDMAGYRASFNLYDKKHEDKVFIRGLEFTAFSANIQTHGNVKRPYDFDEHTKAVYRAYSNLHVCLKPYIIEQASVTCVTGIPLMRHLIFHDPSDKNVFDIEDEYMLGCGLLVAPVLKRRKKRNIYLPKGKWIDIFSGKEYEGGRWLKNYRAPLESIPVFRLEGAKSACLVSSLEAAQKYIKDINELSVK